MNINAGEDARSAIFTKRHVVVLVPQVPPGPEVRPSNVSNSSAKTKPRRGSVSSDHPSEAPVARKTPKPKKPKLQGSRKRSSDAAIAAENKRAKRDDIVHASTIDYYDLLKQAEEQNLSVSSPSAKKPKKLGDKNKPKPSVAPSAKKPPPPKQAEPTPTPLPTDTSVTAADALGEPPKTIPAPPDAKKASSKRRSIPLRRLSSFASHADVEGSHETPAANHDANSSVSPYDSCASAASENDSLCSGPRTSTSSDPANDWSESADTIRCPECKKVMNSDFALACHMRKRHKGHGKKMFFPGGRGTAAGDEVPVQGPSAAGGPKNAREPPELEGADSGDSCAVDVQVALSLTASWSDPYAADSSSMDCSNESPPICASRYTKEAEAKQTVSLQRLAKGKEGVSWEVGVVSETGQSSVVDCNKERTERSTRGVAGVEQPSVIDFEERICVVSAEDEQPATDTECETTSPAITRGEPSSQAITGDEPTSPAVVRGEPSSRAFTRGELSSPAITRDEPTSLAITRDELSSPVITRCVTSSLATARDEPTFPAITRGETSSPVITRGELSSPVNTRDEPTSLANIRGQPSSPVITRCETSSPAITRDEPTSLAITRDVLSSPVITRCVTSSLATTRDEPTFPAITRGETSSPVITRGEPSSPLITRCETSSQLITRCETSSPAITRDEPTSLAITGDEPTSPVNAEDEKPLAAVESVMSISDEPERFYQVTTVEKRSCCPIPGCLLRYKHLRSLQQHCKKKHMGLFAKIIFKTPTTARPPPSQSTAQGRALANGAEPLRDEASPGDAPSDTGEPLTSLSVVPCASGYLTLIAYDVIVARASAISPKVLLLACCESVCCYAGRGNSKTSVSQPFLGLRRPTKEKYDLLRPVANV